MYRMAVPLALAALLAGCGQSAELKPRAGQQLPAAPYGRDDRPGANQLLAPRTQDMPQRSDELRSRSEDRQDDPFDLPPQG
ncbi:hypothetical protein H7F51_09615 [Novosphingobium flavum]|uniref:Argininosuccinate lyase n=2 Tax=Novosphingobium flavum TaxID=1778672 RepID=A0A7X1FRS2_9SPHN|nr:hypothetical protein [Novosphingobium flavum]MBC2665780.1 hypothetical protein [Novosphingobium flavum]